MPTQFMGRVPLFRQAQDAINEKYQQLGREHGVLGPARTDLTQCPDGLGFFVHYHNGSIYWSPRTNAHEVHGAVRAKWASLGWERSFLGYPETDESPTPDGVGRFNHFQGGSIYWTGGTGAHEVHGAIRNRWASLGWERSFLGYPITDETPGPNDTGRFNYFQHGMLYWFPCTGAQELGAHIDIQRIVERKIDEKHDHMGGRLSRLGRSTNPALQWNGAQFFKDYRGGQIQFSLDDGPVAFVTFRTIVRFRGIHCFGKSEAVDEPYAVVSVYRPDAADKVVTKRFPAGRDSYEDFVAGTDATEAIDVFSDLSPQTIAICSTVMEHDSGDPSRVAEAIDNAVRKAADAAGAADEVSTFTGFLRDLGVPELVGGLLGVGDDLIGSQTFTVDFSDLIPGRPMQTFGNIRFNFESPLLSDGDASYKLYYEVFAERVTPPERQ